MQMQSWLRAEQCRKRGRSRTNTLAERTQNHHQESDNHNHIVPSDPILISLIKSVSSIIINSYLGQTGSYDTL